MKKLFVVLSVLFVSGIVNAQQRIYHYDTEFTLSTMTATLVAPVRPGRRYFLFVNINSTYDCLLSTYVVKVGETAGKYIYTSGGHWQDEYNVYTSSYWAIALSSGTVGQVKVKVTEKE